MFKPQVKAARVSKHQASKRGFSHNWNPSKGQMRDITNDKSPLGVIKGSKPPIPENLMAIEPESIDPVVE